MEKHPDLKKKPQIR